MIATPIPNRWPTLSSPLDGARLRVMSFGAGVQSTTIALMAAEGLIGPMPDFAIFADTGDEPIDVYEHLRFMKSANIALPFPILDVTAGSIREQVLRWTRGDIANSNGRPPLFIKPENGGRPQLTQRQCTQDWKIKPIERHLRDFLGFKRGSPGPRFPVVEQWIGISTDEVGRMKPARKRWIKNRHPLIEADMDRRACERFLEARGINAPKSACRICPFHTDLEWKRLQTQLPDDFEAACEVDDALRAGHSTLRGTPYLHRSCRPLREIDFTNAGPEPVAWLGECDGVCGV